MYFLCIYVGHVIVPPHVTSKRRLSPPSALKGFKNRKTETAVSQFFCAVSQYFIVFLSFFNIKDIFCVQFYIIYCFHSYLHQINAF